MDTCDGRGVRVVQSSPRWSQQALSYFSPNRLCTFTDGFSHVYRWVTDGLACRGAPQVACALLQMAFLVFTDGLQMAWPAEAPPSRLGAFTDGSPTLTDGLRMAWSAEATHHGAFGTKLGARLDPSCPSPSCKAEGHRTVCGCQSKSTRAGEGCRL